MATIQIFNRSWIKTFLYVFLMLMAIAVIVFEVKTHQVPDYVSYLYKSHRLSFTPKVIREIGLLVLFLAGFGYYATIKENASLLFALTVFLWIFLTFEVVIAVSLFIIQYNNYLFLYNSASRVFNSYNENPMHKYYVDKLQTVVQCCGASGAEDLKEFMKYDLDSYTIPVYPNSCCKENGFQLFADGIRRCTAPYMNGCAWTISNINESLTFGLYLIAALIVVIQLAIISLAYILENNIRRQNKVQEKRLCEVRKNLLTDCQAIGKSDPKTTVPVFYGQSDFTTKTPII